ncbi:hypothetical protein CANINC_001761 [Pichia inconspicua]|uniref:Zn(2)-C6 fungal-type domain-containing protein n=1 Tax=Pichia inconspicua TaxID=52247 RepID=A0A4T0X420_9ASCO|nr:hypothetical protein CANINC_001761 [[Candida] inconspicua]
MAENTNPEDTNKNLKDSKLQESLTKVKTEKKTRKRNRVPVSCCICRRRKIRCDKSKPKCTNCIKNNVAHLCCYLEPKWAQPIPNTGIDQQITQHDPHISLLSQDSGQSTPQTVKFENIDESFSLRSEIETLQGKIKLLEDENTDLKRKIITTSNHQVSNPPIVRIKPQDSDELMDSIFNSNILFIAQKSNQYNIPITYQISVFSWMFVVKNDLYLNDLWMKILKLRQHYEYYYNSKGSVDNKMISHYNSYGNRLSKFKNNTSLKTSIIPQEKTSEHTSKLKKFLEKSLNLEKHHISINPTNTNEVEVRSHSPLSKMTTPSNICPVTGVVGVCPMGNSIEKISPSKESVKSNGSTNSEDYLSSNNSTPSMEKKTPTHNVSSSFTINRCPVLLHSSSKKSNLSRLNTNICLADNNDSKNNDKNNDGNENDDNVIHKNNHDDDDYDDDDDDNDDDDELLKNEKVCPLMIGNAKALFKEKLTKMNISAIRDSHINSKRKVHSPNPAKSRGTPIIPSGPSTPLSEINPHDTDKLANFVPIAIKPETPSLSSRQSSVSGPTKRKSNDNLQQPKKLKKMKTISSSYIKTLNYNNTKQIINVIEQYLPNKKVVTLLIDRFFDKLYIHMPYVDETSFRAKINNIIKMSDSNQKIKLSSVGSQYCEDFLYVCLLLIIVRLSWLSLPDKDVVGISQNEQLLIKPENFISFVLVDLVKEVFSSAKIMSKPSVLIFQVGLFLKIYSTISPEDGFDTDDSYTRNSSLNNSNNSQNSESNSGSADSSNNSPFKANDLSGDLSNEAPNINSPNFIAMLVQLAHTIGLNRDPLNFKNFYPTANDDDVTVSRLFKTRHLWRKLWYGLLFMTVEANLSLGDYKKGLAIELDLDPTLGSSVNKSWDCRLPGGIEQGVLENSFENSKLLQRELCVVQIFRESIVAYKWIYQGMKLLFSVDKVPTTQEVENVVVNLNNLVSEKSKYGFGIDLIMGDQEIVNPFRARNSSVWVKKYTKQIKVARLKVHLIVKNMISSLDYLLFLNHEQKLSILLSQRNATIEKIEKQRGYIETFFESSLLSSIENFKLFVQFTQDVSKVFPICAAELLLYPFLMILNHRSHEFLISLVLRVQQNSPVIMEILKKNKIDPKELQKRLFTYLETFIEKLDALTKNYYYAWVLKRLVKFFYNILTNSQKLFKINFKRMPVPDNTNYTAERKIPIPESSAENGEKSAFEIAFGTSKLPPVTDYTHDDRREINFNPTTSNSNFLIPSNGNTGNENSNNQLNNVMMQSINSDVLGHSDSTISAATNVLSPQVSHYDGFNSLNTSNNLQMNHNNLHLNLMQQRNLHSANGSVSSTNSDRWNGMMGEELNELFDDQFLNDIGGLAMETVNNTGLLGLHTGLSQDTISPNPNLEAVNQARMNGRLMSNAFAVGSHRMDVGSSSMNSNSFVASQFNGMGTMNNNLPSGKGEMFNSLNEIDFTNVDLNTPIDNIVYGFDLTMAGPVNSNAGVQAPTNSMHPQNNSNTKPTPNSGLGNWNFF